MNLEQIDIKARGLVLLEFEKMKQDLISKHLELGMKASGKWIDSLEVIEQEITVKLIGEKYTDQLVYGRKGGTRPPIQAIENWIVNKGFSYNIPLRSLAWAIAKKIEKDGTRYYQQGGTDLVSSVITPERINKIITLVGEELTVYILPIFVNRYREAWEN